MFKHIAAFTALNIKFLAVGAGGILISRCQMSSSIDNEVDADNDACVAPTAISINV